MSDNYIDYFFDFFSFKFVAIDPFHENERTVHSAYCYLEFVLTLETKGLKTTLYSTVQYSSARYVKLRDITV